MEYFSYHGRDVSVRQKGAVMQRKSDAVHFIETLVAINSLIFLNAEINVNETYN